MARSRRLRASSTPPVGGGIDLDHVHRCAAAPDEPTALTLATGLARAVAGLAVERHGKHACKRGLAYTTGTAKEVGVPCAVALHRSSQRLGDVLLSRDFAEAAGAVFSGERGMGHAVRMRGRGCWRKTPTPSRRRSGRGTVCHARSGDGLPLAKTEAPQVTRSHDRRTYRCCLHGPDGVRWVFALRTWGTPESRFVGGARQAKSAGATGATRRRHVRSGEGRRPHACARTSPPPRRSAAPGRAALRGRGPRRGRPWRSHPACGR